MFDVGFSELILLAIVALVVLGPEKLPHAARVAGAWVARIRRSISTVQAEIEREVSAQELKTRLAKEFGADSTAGKLMQDLQAETRHIETSLQDADKHMTAALQTETSGTPSVDSASAAPAPAAVDAAPTASLLADVATPLDSVDMDGEAAYRQWLDSQKRNHPVGINQPDQDPVS